MPVDHSASCEAAIGAREGGLDVPPVDGCSCAAGKGLAKLSRTEQLALGALAALGPDERRSVARFFCQDCWKVLSPGESCLCRRFK